MNTLKKQFELIRYEKGIKLSYLIYMIAYGIMPVISIIIPKLIIDAIAGGTKKEICLVITAYIIISLVCALISSAIGLRLRHSFLRMRMREFSKINQKIAEIDYEHNEDSHFKDRFQIAMNAVGGDNQGFQDVYNNILTILPCIFSVIMYIIIICLLNFYIALAVIILFALITLVTTKSKKFAFLQKEKIANANRKMSYIYNTACDFSYGKDIRIYDYSSKLHSLHKERTYSYLSIFKRIANHEFGYGFVEVLLLLLQDGIGYFLVLQAYFSKTNPISLGDVSMYIGAIIALSTTLRTISLHTSKLFDNLRYSKEYFSFMEDQSYCTKWGNLPRLKDTLEIEFRNVSFKYPNTERYILKNFNFKINKGEKVAIVGTNGAGKTTIVKLICGLFKPTEGEILINGININEFERHEYYQMFSVVFQDFNIYASSIIENVIGKINDDSDYERAIKCLDRVGLTEKIASLPLKYDQPLLKVIEDNGTELSGGESQKIAIARALFKDGNMVILDEPTAALDALAEADIYQRFDDLVASKTAIYISHRLSSTKFCDHIALFNKDGLKEYGTHEELLKLKGEYYQMFMVQGKYYQEENADEK